MPNVKILKNYAKSARRLQSELSKRITQLGIKNRSIVETYVRLDRQMRQLRQHISNWVWRMRNNNNTFYLHKLEIKLVQQVDCFNDWETEFPMSDILCTESKSHDIDFGCFHRTLRKTCQKLYTKNDKDDFAHCGMMRGMFKWLGGPLMCNGVLQVGIHLGVRGTKKCEADRSVLYYRVDRMDRFFKKNFPFIGSYLKPEPLDMQGPIKYYTEPESDTSCRLNINDTLLLGCILGLLYVFLLKLWNSSLW